MLRKALCTWLAAAALAQLARSESDFIDPQQLADAGLSKFWQFRLPLTDPQRIADVYLVDDALYCATKDGWVYSLDARTGVLRWVKQITSSSYRVKRPCHADDRVIIATTAQVTQLDRYVGDGILRTDFGFSAGSAPISDGLRYYLGGMNHRYYAFEVGTGREAWKAGANGPIYSRPALHSGYIFIAGQDSGVYAATADQKRLHWQNATHGPNTADLVVDDRGVFVASEDHSLYLFDIGFGQIAWRARFSSELYEPPVLTPETAYQYCADDGLVAVNTDVLDVEQRFRWKLPRGRSLLTIDAQYAYVLMRDNAVVAAKRADGSVSHTIHAHGFSIPVPSPTDGTIYLASQDGRLFCARSKTVPFLQVADLRSAAGGKPAEAAAEEKPAIHAAPRQTDDFLKTNRGGVPLGGKSKVTREYKEEPRPEAPPAEKPSTDKPAPGDKTKPADKPKGENENGEKPIGDEPDEKP